MAQNNHKPEESRNNNQHDQQNQQDQEDQQGQLDQQGQRDQKSQREQQDLQDQQSQRNQKNQQSQRKQKNQQGQEDQLNRGDGSGTFSDDPVEQISMGTVMATDATRRHRMMTSIIAIVVAVVVVVAGIGGVWMWRYRWRDITVTVDGQSYTVPISTTVAQLLGEHDNFGKKPGNYLAVDGSVITEGKGKPISVTVNGNEIPVDKQSSTQMVDNATIDVADGANVTESYTVHQVDVPYGYDLDVVGGSIQILTQKGVDGLQEQWVGDDSGKKVGKTVLKKPVDMVVKAVNPRPEGKKVIALTFDDGPSEYTDAILKILTEKGVKATFFDLGNEALAYPDQEKAMVKDGMQVASHSNTHPYLPDMSAKDLRSEIETGFANIKKASDTVTTVFRAPYGAFGEQQWKDAAGLISMNVLWDIDSLDWKRPGVDTIVKNVVDNAHNGAIALMHDGGGDRSEDVAALPTIIDDLKKAGYSFVTVEELVKMCNYTVAKP